MGWPEGTFSPQVLSIRPGQAATAQFAKTPPAGTELGTYTVNVTATNPAAGLSATDTASCTVVPPRSISGRVIFDDAGLPGVTLTLSGTQNATTVTDSDGKYAFTGLGYGGTYTIKPSLEGYTFEPSNRFFSPLTQNFSNSDFTASSPVSISGQITKDGTPLSGLSVRLSGSRLRFTLTDSQGNYRFTNLPVGGNFRVEGWDAGYTYSPEHYDIANLKNMYVGADFTATIRKYAISGQVTLNGSGLSGITVTLSGSQSAIKVTDTNGNYSFPNLPHGGNYTVTPSHSTHEFTPPSLTFTSLSGDKTANFEVQLNRYIVSGRITLNGGGVGEVVVVLSVGNTSHE